MIEDRLFPGKEFIMKLTKSTMYLFTCLALLPAVTMPAAAQRPEPEVHGTFDGELMYTVLPPNAIPAITAPEFVSGDEAEQQMLPGEPVLGVVLGGESRAYSAWQLDAHEIVNDVVGETAIAVTW